MGNFSISGRIYAGIAALSAVLALTAWFQVQSDQRADSLLATHQSSTTAATALADAQSALWELRYGFAQLMVLDDAGRQNVRVAEPQWQMAQQNSALVEQSATAAESLKGQAERLGTVVARFRLTAG